MTRNGGGTRHGPKDTAPDERMQMDPITVLDDATNAGEYMAAAKDHLLTLEHGRAGAPATQGRPMTPGPQTHTHARSIRALRGEGG